MAKTKVILDYSTNRYTDSEFGVKTSTIATSLADNPNFESLRIGRPKLKRRVIFTETGWIECRKVANK